MKYIKGVLVRPTDAGNIISVMSFPYDNHKSLYSILNCSTFTIATRKIGDKYFDIYCDDEGLLKDDYKFAAATKGGDEILAGNLFIVMHDDDGNIKSISDKDVDMIMNNVYVANVGGLDTNLLMYSF